MTSWASWNPFSRDTSSDGGSVETSSTTSSTPSSVRKGKTLFESRRKKRNRINTPRSQRPPASHLNLLMKKKPPATPVGSRSPGSMTKKTPVKKAPRSVASVRTRTTPSGQAPETPSAAGTPYQDAAHGLSVIVNAPAVFQWTAQAAPERHARCARILESARLQRTQQQSSDCSNRTLGDAGEWLAEEITLLCESLNVPMGLKSFGYGIDDIPALVDGTIQQHRVTKISPRPVDRPALEYLFEQAM